MGSQGQGASDHGPVVPGVGDAVQEDQQGKLLAGFRQKEGFLQGSVAGFLHLRGQALVVGGSQEGIQLDPGHQGVLRPEFLQLP